nr:glycoside hydrolase domain-containing protein [Nannocystis sp. RBIL2]
MQVTKPIGIIADAEPGAQGFDTNAVVTSELARAFAADGYRFCVRYVSHREDEGAHDMTTSEAEAILAAGLALMLVQHVRRPGHWAPTAALGGKDGQLAAHYAAELGCPPGLSLWCDLEGAGTQTADIIAYANAWYEAVHGASFTPGLYVGTFALSGLQLYRQLAFTSYWKAGMKVADVETRGYQMLQHGPGPAKTIQYDRDTIMSDHLRGLPRWLVRAPSQS